jgi:hypothetical protein
VWAVLEQGRAVLWPMRRSADSPKPNGAAILAGVSGRPQGCHSQDCARGVPSGGPVHRPLCPYGISCGSCRVQPPMPPYVAVTRPTQLSADGSSATLKLGVGVGTVLRITGSFAAVAAVE